MIKHRSDYKRWKDNSFNKLTSFDIFEKYGIENVLKDIKDTTIATKIAWGINAGSILKEPIADVTGGYQMAINRVEEFYDTLGKFAKQGGKILPLLLLLGGGAYYYFKIK
jgi:hypothetical protein